MASKKRPRFRRITGGVFAFSTVYATIASYGSIGLIDVTSITLLLILVFILGWVAC